MRNPRATKRSASGRSAFLASGQAPAIVTEAARRDEIDGVAMVMIRARVRTAQCSAPKADDRSSAGRGSDSRGMRVTAPSHSVPVNITRILQEALHDRCVATSHVGALGGVAVVLVVAGSFATWTEKRALWAGGGGEVRRRGLCPRWAASAACSSPRDDGYRRGG